jgi:hypothetical protein
MNLFNLAPDIQEALLFLPRTLKGNDLIHLRQLQPIAAIPDWRKQRRVWKDLHESRSSTTEELSVPGVRGVAVPGWTAEGTIQPSSTPNDKPEPRRRP